MKRIQRSISFLLALVMVFSVVPPMEVHAEETEPTGEIEAVMTVEETTVPTEAVTESAEETTAPTESMTEATEEIPAPTEEIVLMTSIEITAETDCIAPGETLQLTATVLPEDATNQDVIWSSLDESVLKVDENGLVIGVVGGCTFVSATSADGSITAQYEIAVFDENIMVDEGVTWASDNGTEYYNLREMFQTVGRPGHYVFMSGKGNMVQHAVMLMGVEKDHIKVLEYGGIDGYKVRKESEYPYSYLMNYGEISICEANNFDNFTESEILKKINEIYLIFEAWSDETYPIFTANKRACVHPKDENGKDTYACSNCDVVNVVAALKNAGIVDFSYSSHAYTCVGFCHFATRYIYEKTIFGGNQSIIAFANTATSISGSGDIEDDNIDPTPDLTPEQYLSRYKKSMTEISKIAIPKDGESVDSWKLPWTNADENGNQDETLKQNPVTGRITLTHEIVNHMGNTWYEYDTGTDTRGFVYSGDIYILPEHTITLDPNGGSCDVKEIVLVDGQHKLELPIPTRTGYTFDGWWYEDDSGSYEIISGKTYQIGQSGTFHAHWIQNVSVDPPETISAADYLTQYAQKVTSINKTAVTAGSDPITTWKLPWTNTKNGVQDESLKLGTLSGGITLVREVVNHAGNIWYEYETGTSTRGFVYHIDVSFETVKPYCTVKPHSEPTEDNTVLYATWNNPSGITLTHGGFRLGTNPNNLTQYRETVASGWETAESIPCSYDLKNDYDVNLQPGTTYYYQFFIEASDEAVYSSEMNSFTTAGKAYIIIDEAEYWITEDMVLTENILIAEGSSVYIDEGVTVTVPAGMEVNIQGYVEVYGNLVFEDGGILTITDEYTNCLNIWTGKLDVTKADLSGIHYGSVGIQLNSTAEIKGIPDEMLYATTYVYSTEDVNAALAQASSYKYLDVMVDSSFTLTNSITIPDNTEFFVWQWDSDADLPSVVVPNGVTVTNNGWFTVDSGRFVVEEGAKLINNSYATARTYGLLLVLGEFQQNDTFEGIYYGSTMSQAELESDLADCVERGNGWIHENETVIHSDMTIDLGEKEFRLSKYGSIIVAEGATLTVNSSMATGCWDYGDHECGQIIIKNGSKLVINGDLQTYDTAELVLEDGAYLEINGRILANDAIILGEDSVIELSGYWIGYAPINNGGTILPEVTEISVSTEDYVVNPNDTEYITLIVSVDGGSINYLEPGVILGATWSSSDPDIIDPAQIKDHGVGEYQAEIGDKTGTVTLTATSIDGSGKTASITLKVGTDVENRVNVPAAELNGHTSIWIDGKEYALQTDGDNCYVDLPDSNAKTMIAYTYHVDDASDVHTQYPVSMKVWTLSNEDGLYTATRAEELDDILQYSGSSIRVTGKQGIRMITSIEKSKKKALISDGLAGYTLKEYGTVVAWTRQMGTNPLVLGKAYAKSNYAYKQGVADPVFAYDSDRMQYTNVLVGFSNAQCKNDLAMRPYMILEDAEGNEITLYGGIVTRSIGYIAYQNRNYFEAGTEAYGYVWNIIHSVYGDAYDAEYQE